MMGLFHWIDRLVWADKRRHSASRQASKGARDDAPADEVVQQLFKEIRQGGPSERRAWISLAEYLAWQGEGTHVRRV